MIPYLSHATLLKVFLRPLLSKIIICCSVLSALLEVLALLDEASVILGRHQGVSGILKFILLHLPTLVVEIMPLSVMIGGLFTLLQMTLSSEIAVLRAAGLSTLNMYRYLLPGPIILGTICTIIQFWVVPPCEQELNRWWNESATQAHDGDDIHGAWFRYGDTLARVDAITHGGRNLSGVAIYFRDSATGLLTSSQTTDNLSYENNHWVHTAEAQHIDVNLEQTKARIVTSKDAVPLKATPTEIINMTLSGVYYTPHQLYKILTGKAPSNLPDSNYFMAICAALILPIQMAVMLLITLPITYIPPRAGLRNPLPVYVMAAGLGVVMLQGMISALGNAGSLPVLLAVSSGQIIAALLGLAWVLRMEEK